MKSIYCFLSSIFAIIISILFLSGCTKENNLVPTGRDENIYINKDNPNDPVDHAMFLFYKETGIANFYSDTVSVQKISKEGEVPERFRYLKVGLNYVSAGFSGFTYTKLSDKQMIPGILEMLKQEVIPQLPADYRITSFLFLNDITNSFKYTKVDLVHGMSAFVGFNTVGLIGKNTTLMNVAEKEMYKASILAGLAIPKIIASEAAVLKSDFFDITRELSKTVIATDVYSGIPVFTALPDPRNVALLHFPFSNIYGFDSIVLPTEESDLRSFLTMVFRYDDDTFNSMYQDYPSIISKYNFIKELLISKGYQLAP